jgi:hypothetical protein
VNNTIVGNGGFLGNVQTFVKRWLHVLYELGKLIQIVEYLSRFEPETPMVGI